MMHDSSYRHMSNLVVRFLAPLEHKPLRILDVRSCDINGTYRPLFQNPNWQYTGANVAPGPNVDIVLADPYRWSNVKTRSANVM